MWEAIGLISSGLTLAAFVTAVIASVIRSKSEQKERLIKSAPKSERTDLVQDALEFFHVDTEGLTKQKKFEVAMAQISARSQRFKLITYLVGFVAILTASVAVYALYIVNPALASNSKPTPDISLLGIKSSEREDINTPSATLSLVFDDGSEHVLSRNTGATGSGADYVSAQVSKDCNFVAYTAFTDSNTDSDSR